MISSLPWRLTEDGDKIYDADNNIIAKDYKFLHLDDFQSICRLITNKKQNCIKPNMRVKVFDPCLYKDDKTTPLSVTVCPATVTRCYKKRVKAFNIKEPLYDDLIDVLFDHKPDRILHGHFRAGVKVIYD
jgi:hypothetical protein